LLNFFNIFALLLALPLQMLAFVQTVEHMVEHKAAKTELDQHSHDEDNHHADEDHSPVDTDSAEHQHGEGEPVHSHAKELSGVLIQIGMPSFHSSVSLTSNSKEALHQFPTKDVNSQTIRLSLLRPPIV
jgi:hypothetical protein